jgi:hypothetical protein
MNRIDGLRLHARLASSARAPLGIAVRRALVLGSGLLACGVTIGLTNVASAAAFPAVFPLVRLTPPGGGNGSEGFVLQGIKAFDGSGYAVRGAGDLNGDGRDDLIIGAAFANQGTHREAGESEILFGSATGFPAVFQLSKLLPPNGGDGSKGLVLQGIDTYDFAGRSVDGIGDINGDGIDDVAIGADFADPQQLSSAGEVYVVFGRNTAQAGNYPPVLPLQGLLPSGGGDGSAGFVLAGVDAFDQAGHSISRAGDVNGDGIDDLLIGAFGADPSAHDYAGESYVVFGRNTAVVGRFPAVLALATLLPSGGGDGSTGVAIAGANVHDQSGISVSGVGDINGDGIDDILIGARLASPRRTPYAGETFVVFGRNDFPALLQLVRLLPSGGGDGSEGFVLNGVAQDDFSGAAVRGAGDVNGDGIDDLIIGAYRAGTRVRPDTGVSYVVFGRTQPFPASYSLTRLLPTSGGDGSEGVVLTGVDPLDYSGSAVSGVGDVNGDGYDDVIVGAKDADGGGLQNAGESYVVFGRATFPAVLALNSLLPGSGGDGSSGFVLPGIDPFDYSGYAVSGAGDVNGDGIDDLFIGAPYADPAGQDTGGESYVVFGRR